MTTPRTHRVDRPVRRWRPIGAVACLVVALGVLLVGGARPAGAHAELIGSDPSDGAVLAAAPSAVTLRFTETVTVQADGVRVLDAQGGRVDGGAASAAGAVVEAPLADLADGGYVVAWRVVSADGHPIRGAFTFSVGEATSLNPDLADEAFAGSGDRRHEVVGAVLRGLTYVAVLGVSGLVLVGASLRRPGERPPLGRAATVAVVVGLVAVLLQLPVQAALATGRGWGALTDEGVLGLVLRDGVGWSLAMIGGGLVALLLTSGLPMVGAVKVLTYAGAVVAPLGLVVAGHTRTMSPSVVGYAADAVHVLAGAVWFGGLMALAAVVRRRRAADDPGGAAEAVATFSGWAFWSASAVVVAGVALSLVTVGSIDGLTSTTYGRLLMAKVAVVAAVIAGAAWNRYRFVPTLEPLIGGAAGTVEVEGSAGGGDEADPAADTGADRVAVTVGPTAAAWSRFGTVVRFEVLALVVVLALTGVLSNVTPAKYLVGSSGPVNVTAPFGEGTMDVTVDPAQPGRNDVHVYLLDESGAPDDRFSEAVFRLELPEQDLGPLEREPVRVGPGHFQLVGTPLELPGTWELTVVVRPDRFTEITGTAELPVS